MEKFKTKSILLLVLSLLCAAILACGISLFKVNFAAAYQRTTTDKAAALLVSPNDLYNASTHTLDSTVLDTLASKLLGSGKTGSDLITTANSGTELNAANFRTNNGGTEVTVKFGGIDWIPAYLSRSISGIPILTLYHAGVSLAGITASTNFSTTQLASPMTDGWTADSQNWDTPGMMYGSSYMRAVTLNNGGYYSAAPNTAIGSADIGKHRTPTSSTITLVDATSYAEEATDNIYYPFTRGELSDLIVTPRDVQWQSDMQLGVLSTTKTYNNESWNDYGTSYAINTSYYFGNKPLYSQWADDKVWIPSVTELGNATNATGNGIWSLSQEQKKTDTGVRTPSQVSSTGSGTELKAVYRYTWTRTGVAASNSGFYMFADASAGTDGSAQGSAGVGNAFCVRPAIHLALTNVSAPTAVNEEETYDATDSQIFKFNFDTVRSRIKGVTATTFATSTAASTAIASDSYSVNSDNELVAKYAGTYKIEFELVQPTDPELAVAWGDKDRGTGTRTVTVTLKRKGLAVPTIGDDSTTYVYKGTAHEFELSGDYKSSLMDITRPTGITWDSSTNTYSDGLAYNSDDKVFSATNAGTYNVIFKLKDEQNYDWGTDGSNDLAQKTVPVKIEKQELSISAKASDTSLTWKKKDAGTITLTPDACKNADGVEDTVLLYLYYQKDGGNALRSGVTGHVLDVSKITSTGTFTLCARLLEKDDSSDGNIGDNNNYTITVNDGVWKMSSTFEITASGISADDLTWQYTMTGQALPSDLLEDGEQVSLQYGEKINYTISALGTSDMKVYDYTGDGFVNGYKTVDSDGNVLTAGGNAVGTYTTYVAIEITNTADYAFDSDHILDGNPKYGWLSIDWTVSPRELDFKDAEWEYTTDGGTTWIPFKQSDGTQSDPEYTGVNILVRISPDYLSGLGLDPDSDVNITYGGSTMKKDKATYKATAEIVINNPSYCTPETDDGSDYKISFDWSITNKKIQIKNWNGSQTLVLDNGQAFSIPTVQTADGTGYRSLAYTYECVIDGVTRTVSGLDGLKALLQEANVSDTTSLTITATVSVKSTLADSYTLAGTATKEFDLGDSKDVVDVWLKYEQCEYGEIDFMLYAEYGEVDYSEYISVTLSSVLMSEPVTVAMSNQSALLEYLVKTGSYDLTFEISNPLVADVCLLNPTTLTFTITPKQVYVPTVNREIVFTGSNINLMNYLDGFDPVLMTLDTLEHRDAGTVYTATFTLIDQFNYVFVMKPTEDSPTEATKSTVKIALTGYENSVSFANDEHTVAEMKWQINPFVLDGSYWSLNGKEGAVFNLPTGFGELDLDVGYRYFNDAASTSPMDPVFKGGESYYVDVFLTGDDAKNFVFENGTTVSDKVVYTVPKSGAAAFFGSALGFVKSNWLWFVIGAAILLFLILLIIIIAAAKKKKKKKEEEKKEEAKAANAAAAGMPMAAMAGLAMADDGRAARAEAEAAKAKAEAQIEVERAKMQAEMAKMRAEAEAEKARAQAQQQPAPQLIMQQPAPQQAPQPVQQPAPQVIMQQPAQQAQNNVDPYALAEIKAELAALRAAQSAQTANAPAASPAPAPSADGGMMMAMMQAQLAEMRAQQNAALKTELEIMKAKLDERRDNYSRERDVMPAELLGNAIISAISKIASSARQPQREWEPHTIKSDPPVALNAPTTYPPDAVITTTTTVDTTSRTNDAVAGGEGDHSSRRDDTLFDIDGFYDEINVKKK